MIEIAAALWVTPPVRPWSGDQGEEERFGDLQRGRTPWMAGGDRVQRETSWVDHIRGSASILPPIRLETSRF